MSDVGGEVRLGSMLFTLVDPHPGHEVAYNRWYERDHFYAGCMVGPWLFAGRRFVATRDLKALRFGADVDRFGGATRGSYLAVYWILEGRHDEHVDWALRQVHWLHANGRMFAERDHVHTLLYRHVPGSETGDSGVPAELALDHPFGGLVATLVRPAAGVDPSAVGEALRAARPEALHIAFSPIPLPADAPVTQAGLDGISEHVLVLAFEGTSPAASWDAWRAAAASLDADGIGQVAWSAPFVPTVPGTDEFADQLW